MEGLCQEAFTHAVLFHVDIHLNAREIEVGHLKWAPDMDMESGMRLLKYELVICAMMISSNS